MKRIGIIGLVFAIVFSACFMTAPAAHAQGNFLIMIYLCGTDLESQGGAASQDLIEMIEAGITQDSTVNVLVQAGGTNEWQTGILESGESQRFIVQDDLYAVEDSLGQLDMGSPDTLRDFISYGLDNYPAERVGLILWDHGAGAAGGVCYDEMTGNSISTSELYDALFQALNSTNQKLAFIGFDACLMSTYEVAVHLKPFTDYMIASEELEPGSGWAYDRWLKTLNDNPSMDTQSVGRAIVDSFIESSLENDPNDYVTLAVTDLNELDNLVAAVNTFGETLTSVLQDGQFPAISRARAQMRAFGDFADASSDMVDIADAAWYCRDIVPDAAKALTQAMKNAVVYNRNSANIQSAGGLSILLPDKTKDSASEYLLNYDVFSLMTGYADFVTTYVKALTDGNYSFAPTSIQSVAVDANDESTMGWLSSFVSGLSTPQTVQDSWWTSIVGSGSDDQTAMTQADYESVATAYGNEAQMVQLSQDDLDSLSYVEATLLQDATQQVDGDYGDECYFDYGLMQDVYVDWDTGHIYGLFDGTWPTLEGQMVPMYDQVITPDYSRSLIPALVNDKEQYLLVVFNETNPAGAVVGYSAGYDDNGNPARGYTKLKAGDVIFPMYDLLYWDENENSLTQTYYGEEIIVGNEHLQFSYETVEAGEYQYAFCLNDVYGGYEFTDFATLTFE